MVNTQIYPNTFKTPCLAHRPPPQKTPRIPIAFFWFSVLGCRLQNSITPETSKPKVNFGEQSQCKCGPTSLVRVVGNWRRSYLKNVTHGNGFRHHYRNISIPNTVSLVTPSHCHRHPPIAIAHTTAATIISMVSNRHRNHINDAAHINIITYECIPFVRCLVS